MDTLLTFLRDPIWQFFGVVIAIIALLVAIFRKSWLRYAGIFVVIIIVLAGVVVFVLFPQTQWDKSDPNKLYTQVTSSNTSLYDPLNGPSANNWDYMSRSCDFKNGAYHSSATQPGVVAECLAEASLPSSNFGYQVQMTVLSGNGGGLIFGAPGTNAGKYRFFVGTGAFYDVFLSKEDKHIIPGSSSRAIHTGFNQQNVLTVIVLSSIIYIYINGVFVGMGNTLGNSPISGKIGVFADEFKMSHNDPTPTPTDVIFSNVKVWKL